MDNTTGGEVRPEDLKEAMVLTLKRGGKVRFIPGPNPAGLAGAGGGAHGQGGTPTMSGGMVIEGATLTDEVRGLLAIWAFAILTVLIVGVLIALAAGSIRASDLTPLIQAIFAGTSGIIGAIVGFYFAGQQSKSQSGANPQS